MKKWLGGKKSRYTWCPRAVLTINQNQNCFKIDQNHWCCEIDQNSYLFTNTECSNIAQNINYSKI